MFKAIIPAAIALAALPAFAQDTANVEAPGSVAALDVPYVVGQCELVAGQSEDSNSYDGACISATQAFLDGLVGDPADVDASITNLVVAIAPLVQDETCNNADEEIAQAIRLASTRASDPEQVTRLIEIADTVAACVETDTAAIEAEPDDSVSPG